MDYGVVMFPTEYSIAPDELARALEERGFESLWFPEHTHIPASRKSPWPGGGELPREYWSAYDPFVALMAAAAATKRLKLGTGICLVIERDPIVTAKEVATLDRLSGGRVLFGIGGGWNAEEMEQPRHRLEEPLAAAARAGAGHEGDLDRSARRSYHGEFVRFDQIWSDPKPVQKPHPPIIIGGDGATTFDRVVEFGDGWMPIMRPHANPVEKIPALRERLKTAGRDPQIGAGVDLLRAAQAGGARRARGGGRHARHLRPAVRAARRRCCRGSTPTPKLGCCAACRRSGRLAPSGRRGGPGCGLAADARPRGRARLARRMLAATRADPSDRRPADLERLPRGAPSQPCFHRGCRRPGRPCGPDAERADLAGRHHAQRAPSSLIGRPGGSPGPTGRPSDCSPSSARSRGSGPRPRGEPRPRMKPTSVCPSPTSLPRGIDRSPRRSSSRSCRPRPPSPSRRREMRAVARPETASRPRRTGARRRCGPGRRRPPAPGRRPVGPSTTQTSAPSAVSSPNSDSRRTTFTVRTPRARPGGSRSGRPRSWPRSG